jgi:hypothetical protein
MPSLNCASQPAEIAPAACLSCGSSQHAVLETSAVEIERREHVAVVQLHGIEVTIGHGAQAFA